MSTPKDTVTVPGVGIGEVLGSGAFGTVHRGRHHALDVDVAIKMIRPDLGEPAALDKALDEARLMARLDHPNLLRIHDAGRLGKSIYLVMEFMDGGTLEDLREADSHGLSEIARQLLSGLQALHDARILHRDIKPANCLRRQRDGRIKLADLGIAAEQATRADHQGDLVGTLPFMAPELFEENPVFSPRSDLYALGLTLTCAALGEDPFPTGPIGKLLHWIGDGKRPDLAEARPDLPANLTSVIGRMMSARPEDRPSSAAEALARLSDGTAVLRNRTLPDASSARIGPWVLGATVWDSSNWLARAVTHLHTGAPGRLTHLKPGGPLAASSDLILNSAERASHLACDGILDVLDWGREEDRAYIVTAPQGRTLRDMIVESGPMSEVEALDLVATLAGALAYLHDRGLVYQIAEPGSALLSADGRSVLLGWPIFCVPSGTPAVDGRGTPQKVRVSPFFAPEAVSSKDPVLPTIDLYGLGEILFFVMSGQAAFDKDSFGQIMLSKGRGAPDLKEIVPTITQPTALLVSALLAPDPVDRPHSAADVQHELVRIADRLR